MPPLAVRLRRDFKTVLMLIRAHALLHQATRLRDESGRVVATLDDYRAVRTLVADLVAQGIDATVKPEVRDRTPRVGGNSVLFRLKQIWQSLAKSHGYGRAAGNAD